MDRRKFVVASAAGAVALSTDSALARIKPSAALHLDTLLDVMKTPGLAAKGMVAGKRFVHVAGVRETGKSQPVATDTYFSAGSLSKPVFTMAVRRLVREGKLDWKKPLQDYAQLGLTGDSAGITAENVLTHGTGLVNWRFDPKDELSSAFKPGTRWQYSGEGYVLLQRVVEKMVGEPLGGYLNQKLLPSLGMNKSTFSWIPEIEKNAVAGHNNRGALMERSSVYYEKLAHGLAEKAGSTTDRMTYDQFIEAARNFKSLPMPVVVIPNAAGSLWTTVDEYFIFLEKTVEDIVKHPDEYSPRNRVNRKISWTLSWGVDTSLDSPGYFHWGDGPGVKNFTWIQPVKKTAVVIFTNGDHGAPAYRWLLRHLLNADPLAPEWV